jgi:pilus assembly protein CpaF
VVTWHGMPVISAANWSFPSPEPPDSSAATHALGPLATLGRDRTVTDVFVVADGRVFADRGSGAQLVSDLHIPPPETIAFARALIEAGGRHLDDASPVVDVRLGPGLRVHAALPPVSLGGATVSIRFSRTRKTDLSELNIEWKGAQRDRLVSAVANYETVLISGSTGSGKTTLLGALLARASPRDRIVVLEDVAELDIDHPHVVQLECRQANLEGVGEIPLERLVRESLRMRPSRLVVGECRGAELRDLLAALTSGHRGGASTIHASSVELLPERMEALATLAGLSDSHVARQVAAAFDLLVHISVGEGGVRHVELGTFAVGAGGELVVENIVAES